jgi:hypothetical protein
MFTAVSPLFACGHRRLPAGVTDEGVAGKMAMLFWCRRARAQLPPSMRMITMASRCGKPNPARMMQRIAVLSLPNRAEVAQRLRVPVGTLADWASKGNKTGKRTGPPYAKFGKHARYRLSDVIAWEQQQLRGIE